jgi:hypothetical protein
MYHKLYLLNTGIIGIIVVLIENLTLIKIYNFLLGSFEVGALILGRLYFIETGSEFFTNADMILHTDSSLILFFIGLLF